MTTDSTGASLVEGLPTPLARVRLRLARVQGGERVERFNALQYLSEGLLKYLVLVFHSAVAQMDRATAQFTGYKLVRADGIGEWEESLQILADSVRRTGQTGEIRALLDWLSMKRTGANQAEWFDIAHSCAVTLWEVTADTQADFQRSVHGLFRFLVAFRNKTRGHGAFTRDYYDRVNSVLEEFLAVLTDNSPVCSPALLWTEEVPGGLVYRVLRGPAPDRTEVTAAGAMDTGLVVQFNGGSWSTPFSPLLKYDPRTDSCLFANGAWSEREETCEGLDYLTGTVGRLPVSQFASPATLAVRSETAGQTELLDGANAGHNLPSLFDGYVQRHELESELYRLLTDRVHRVITLRGMGGVGKTSLALKVVRELVDSPSCPFLWIVWFSARDVDLTIAGPKGRLPDVSDVQGIANYFCRLFHVKASGPEAISTFVGRVSDASEPILLIMDNFEALSDQRTAQKYLDETVVLPSKVLITSRHERFQGDYPVQVTGMSDEEAISLLRQEAARLGCAARLAPRVLKDICAATSKVPYAMKLVVAQLSRNLPVEQIVNQALTEEGVLGSLFDRSFTALSADGRRLFLTLGNLSAAIDAIVLRSVFGRGGRSLDAALDECERSSLLQVVESSGRAVVDTPEVARVYARSHLAAAEDSLEIERDLELVRLIQRDADSTHSATSLASFLDRRIRGEPDAELELSLVSVLESLAHQVPDAWKVVASVRQRLGAAPVDVRIAFQRAVEHDRSDGDLWIKWASFEGELGNQRREVELLIRAAECRPHDVRLNSHVALKVAALINSDLALYPLVDRPAWVSIVKRNLDGNFLALDANALSRLGWLHWLINDVGMAEASALRGLALDPDNQHCKNIIARVQSRKRVGRGRARREEA
jgi:hypothetical protein